MRPGVRPPEWLSRGGPSHAGGRSRSPAQLSGLRESRRSCHTPVVRYGQQSTEAAGGERKKKREGGRLMAAVMTTPRIELEPAVTRTVRRVAPPPLAPGGHRPPAAPPWPPRAAPAP